MNCEPIANLLRAEQNNTVNHQYKSINCLQYEPTLIDYTNILMANDKDNY